ncbi:hypothetical protein RH831_09305 [Halodesulfurarchaeum sp. HSR-GB]|uniref:hypothetical protein n=1 Tax=Halodesulfurarchaeum sp. HSR-GB TaxID=3074077 RepID=UPI00285FF562|nr:hypothetical protein [Halodesulfurarchaeum sp. HSR-GB]MDR5657376.1 hypothetical protein [Halodesulfurarchaeum sp. HSR-GB]
MSVPHPGGDPNANLYAQLKRDVLDRVPEITLVEYEPDPIEARQLRAVFDPDRLPPATGPESPELTIRWYRQDPHDWFRVDYIDPNTGIRAGWHQDEDHPDLGRAHFQYTIDDETNRRAFSFEHETPSLILWDIVSDLFDRVLPKHQSSGL